jgi:hypothetical protein
VCVDAMIRGWKGEKEPVWAELDGWLELDGCTSAEACTDRERYPFVPGGDPAGASPYDAPYW